MEDLKICNLCGHNASVDLDDDGFYYVGCDFSLDCPNNVFMRTQAYCTETAAINAWNEEQG